MQAEIKENKIERKEIFTLKPGTHYSNGHGWGYGIGAAIEKTIKKLNEKLKAKQENEVSKKDISRLGYLWRVHLSIAQHSSENNYAATTASVPFLVSGLSRNLRLREALKSAVESLDKKYNEINPGVDANGSAEQKFIELSGLVDDVVSGVDSSRFEDDALDFILKENLKNYFPAVKKISSIEANNITANYSSKKYGSFFSYFSESVSSNASQTFLELSSAESEEKRYKIASQYVQEHPTDMFSKEICLVVPSIRFGSGG